MSSGTPTPAGRDVTAQLRPQHERFRRVVENTDAGYFLIGLDGCYQDVNPAWLRMHGFTRREDAIGLHYSAVQPPEDRVRAEQAVEALLRGGSLCGEFSRLRRDGSVGHHSFSANSVIEGERVVGIEGFLIDITDRKRAEQAVRDSEEKLATVFRSVPAGIAVSDIESGYRFIDVNDHFETIVGYGRDEILGRNSLELGIWVDPAEFSEAIRRVRDDGRLRNFEHRFRRKDGLVRTGLISAEPIRLDSRACLVSATLDITERRQAEQAFRESAQQLLTIANCLPDVLWTMDLSGRFTYASPRIEQTHGWTPEELLRLTFAATTTGAQRMKSEQRLREELIRASSSDYNRDSVITLESEELRKDGTTFWAEVNAALLWSNGSPVGLIGVTRDITERHRHEKERECLQNQLTHAQRMELVGSLAGGIAHDFNNLLSVILMYAESADDEIQSGESAKDAVTAIRDAADRGIALGRQLMAFSSKQVVQTEVLNLNTVIGDSQKLVRRLIGENVKVVFKPGPVGLVRVDRGQLTQILINMAVNSRDAMPEGGTFTIETASIEVGQSNAQVYPGVKPGAFARLAMRDTGIGMDKETTAHVFEPFFTTKRTGKGTGLGLSVVYGIVKQSDGFIEVESEPGLGTEFRIHLPVVSEMSKPVLETEEGPIDGGSETVLLVEDEAALREKLRQVVENAGYQVLVAADGNEAFRLSTEYSGPIDLLITDVVMPEMSGYGLAERLRVSHPQTKLLFMSGYPDLAAGSFALESGHNFIAKPFTKPKLLRRIREVLG